MFGNHPSGQVIVSLSSLAAARVLRRVVERRRVLRDGILNDEDEDEDCCWCLENLGFRGVRGFCDLVV